VHRKDKSTPLHSLGLGMLAVRSFDMLLDVAVSGAAKHAKSDQSDFVA